MKLVIALQACFNRGSVWWMAPQMCLFHLYTYQGLDFPLYFAFKYWYRAKHCCLNKVGCNQVDVQGYLNAEFSLIF